MASRNTRIRALGAAVLWVALLALPALHAVSGHHAPAASVASGDRSVADSASSQHAADCWLCRALQARSSIVTASADRSPPDVEARALVALEVRQQRFDRYASGLPRAPPVS